MGRSRGGGGGGGVGGPDTSPFPGKSQEAIGFLRTDHHRENGPMSCRGRYIRSTVPVIILRILRGVSWCYFIIIYHVIILRI